MPVASGKHILTGSGVEVVTINFRPDLVLLFHSNNGVQDTWESLGAAVGMGIAVRKSPTDSGSLPQNITTHELWSGNTPTSSYLNNVGFWARATHGGGGYAGGVRFFTNTTFSFVYSPGFEGGAGNPVYWLAFGGEDDFVTNYQHYRIGDDGFKTVGFEPTAAFVLGSGGLSNTDGSITLADSSCPCWGATAFADGGGNTGTIVSLSSGVDHGTVDNFFIGDIGNLICADPISAGQQHLIGQWDFARNSTQFRANESDFGLPADNLRLGAAVCGGLAAHIGNVLPANSVGGVVLEPTPFEPVAVIFYGNSPFSQEDFGNEVYGGRAFGFVEQNGGQAIVANGGHAFGTTMGALGMSRFQSDQYCWASNFTEVSSQSYSLNPTYGHAEIPPGVDGFNVITDVIGNPMRSVNYIALGYPADYSGFFEILDA